MAQFASSKHVSTCPEFHQKSNAANDGLVVDSCFPCNCAVGNLSPAQPETK